MSKNQITIPVFVPHLGCPNRCIFCNQWRSANPKKSVSSADVFETAEKYLSKKRADIDNVEIAFFGGSFTGIERLKQKELLSAANSLIESGKVNSIRLSTRPDCIDRGILDFLVSHNVKTVELGCQSFFDDVLAFSNRGHTSDDIYKAADLLKEYGLDFVIQLLPGLPLDTYEKSVVSAKKGAELAPSAARIYPAVVIRDTDMAKLFADGSYSPLLLHDAVGLCSVMLDIFTEKNIPVIRIGIHPLSAEEEDSIIAGPYHHAFGFLTRSESKKMGMEKKVSLIINAGKKESIILKIPKKNAEEYIGHCKLNIEYLKEKFGLKKIEYSIHETDELMVE